MPDARRELQNIIRLATHTALDGIVYTMWMDESASVEPGKLLGAGAGGARVTWDSAFRSVHMTKLQVRRGDFDNHVLVALDQRDPTIHISVWATNGSKFDIDLEERTLSADECTL